MTNDQATDKSFLPCYGNTNKYKKVEKKARAP